MTETGPSSSGSEISADTTLDRDLVRDGGPALVIVADGVTLDLGGHTVSGPPDVRGRGPGILLRGVSGATVRNGTVQRFDAGVAVQGGGGNVIEGLVVENNLGSNDGDFGDGIVVNNSTGNRIQDNVLRSNGPFSGISLGPGASDNEILRNTVADHDMGHAGYPDAGRQTMGIRIEGPAANRNRV
ncbi:MAG: right-handed parallel beta-helix repeat-containing protein, partial [Actinomycetota bacterium]|nr:right-handed parallel beta-helix repeat-containing protein [Actinomycetota bacterium]